MSIYSKARVKTAIETSSRQKLDSRHITTADFMQLNCAYVRHLVPKQSIDVDFNTFARLEALPVPTYGDCVIKHHAFFVPFRTVFPGWNDFITDTPHQPINISTGGLIQHAPQVDIVDISRVLCTNHYTQELASGTGSPDLTMFDPVDVQHQYKFFKLLPNGRQVLKILNQLGYRITTEIADNVQPYYVSALPLLCFCKVYLDWYYPSMYVNDADFRTLSKCLQIDSLTPTLSQADLGYIFDMMTHVNYDADYFTSAFDNPNGPSSGLYSPVSLPDVGPTGYYSSKVSTDVSYSVNGTTSSNGTPVIHGSTVTGSGSSTYPSSNIVSDYIIKSLHRLTDYMKRHQLVGSRSLERYLARFGITLNADKMNRSYMLGNYSQSVNFGAVMSNASTDDANLGSYAGQGFTPAQRDGHFSITTDEYGIFFIMTSIVPRYGYVQGIDRNILHLSKLDFYTPEFDALGCQAISAAELLVNQHGITETDIPSFSNMVDKVFGYAPRYAEYKVALDKLTGDFNVRSKVGAGSANPAWHMFRLFDDEQTSSDYVHSKAFVQGVSFVDDNTLYAGKQYDRIFYNTENEADHFTLVHTFKVDSRFPGRQLFDNYDFDDHAGDVVDVEAGGVKVN